MSTRHSRFSFGLAPAPPDVAFEIAAGRVTVAQVTSDGGGLAVSAWASESLPPGAVTPSLTGPNVPDPAPVTDALRRACERAGVRVPKRAALVIPDSAAKVSLLSFEELPPKQSDVEQLVRWQMKKALPFPEAEAQCAAVVTHRAPGATTVAAVAARRQAVGEYEAAVAALGTQAGLVDIASFSVLNAMLAGGAAPVDDWLLVCLAHESTSLAIVRQGALMFYRHRIAVDDEPIGALVHQTAMYHEDRLGGGKFARVSLCGAALTDGGGSAIRQEIAQRLGVQADTIDLRSTATLRDRVTPGPEGFDALAAPLGILVRERRAA